VYDPPGEPVARVVALSDDVRIVELQEACAERGLMIESVRIDPVAEVLARVRRRR
jgi:uncharacterized spore protein YtfJ